jgi:Holliday junction resolvasome RuvABC endonuclease subunit
MSILALDPATKCGWAMLGDDDRVRSGVWDLSLDKGQPPGARYAFLENELNILHKESPIEVIALEVTPSLRGGNAVKVANGLLAIIQKFGFRRGIAVLEVHASTLKKHLTGNGRAEKGKVAQAVMNRLDLGIVMTDDETDALAVLCWAIDKSQPTKPTTPVREAALTEAETKALADEKPPIVTAKVVDLMAALRESLAKVKDPPTRKTKFTDVPNTEF